MTILLFEANIYFVGLDMQPHKRFSKTMRIDLIPDLPRDAGEGRSKRIVIAAPPKGDTRGQRTERFEGGTNYQQLLQSLYDGTLICDLEGTIVDVNARAVEFLGYDGVEVHGLKVFDLISGADSTLISMVLENLEKEQFTLIQAYCVRKDGTFFPAEIAVSRLHLGRPYLCFFIRDITLRRQAEEMLRTEHSALQNSTNGIVVTDTEAAIEYANPAVARMWGYGSPEKLTGKDVRTLLADAAMADKMVSQVMTQDVPWEAETVAQRISGEKFDVQISAVKNRNSDGETVGMVFSFMDVSDRKRVAQLAKEAERQKVMLETIGAACHHLGQPAAILLANLDVLRKKLEGADPSVSDLVQRSLEAVRSLGAILRRLNAVATYRTTPYLEAAGDQTESTRIIEI
ncbi:MAG: PAS domain-containing protein [Kiritimatiellae bacterium]|nr:PAS domain-containing protein [Kiritimatiellia bacterium]